MAWTTPMTFVDGSALTAAQLNTHLRDNLLSMATAKATVIPGYFVSAGRNNIVERKPRANRVATDESTTSTEYTDLTTVGPSVTVTTGNTALVFTACKIFDAGLSNSTHGMSFAISGATEQDPSNANEIVMDGVPANNSNTFGMCSLLTDLSPGVNTFTCKYVVASGTATFGNRLIAVLPF